jgi:histidine ammonia-lyase
LREVVANVRAVLSVELVTAAQAIDFRAGLARPGDASSAVHALLRSHVPSMTADRHVSDQLVATDALLPELVAAAEDAVGPLA